MKLHSGWTKRDPNPAADTDLNWPANLFHNFHF